MSALHGAAVTDVGRVRSVNQDGALTSAFLAAVADGMGGHKAGEVASTLALRSLATHDHFASTEVFVAAVRLANSSIFRQATERAALRGMGTTLCALALVGGPNHDEDAERLVVVNVGDSRAYQLRDGDLAQLTIDHSLVQMMVREGKLRPEEAANHPQRNIVLRALGIEPDVAVDHWELDVVVGDRFLVCSDGLFNEVSPGRMAATLRAYAEPEEAAKVLVGLANAAGGRDNITCVVVDVVDGDAGDGDAGDGDVAEAADTDADTAAALDRDGDVDVDAGDGTGEAEAPGAAGKRDGAPGLLLSRAAADGDRAATERHTGTTVLTALPIEDLDLGADLDAGLRGLDLDEPRALRPRRLTVRVVAFILVIVVVLGVAVLAVGWYATRTYFVAFEGDQVVIYQGRPGGLLWIEPTVADRADPALGRVTLVGALCDRVEGEPSATSLAAAREIVEQLRRDASQLGAPARPVRRRRLMGRIRRTTELGLLLLGGLIIGGTYTLASLGRTASLPGDIVGFLVVVLGLLLAAHLAVRRLAGEADGLLLPLAGLLNGLGYVFIARTSERLAGLQAAWTAIGLGAFVLTLLLVRRVRDLERYRYTFALIGIGLLLLPLVPVIGQEINGARIWVSLGPLNFQPGEPAKLMLALFLASYLVERRELLAVASLRVGPLSLPDPKHLGPLLAAWGISVLVMVSQKDLGSSLLFFALFIVMVWVATERASYLVMGAVMFAVGATIAYQLFAHVRERVAIWLDPWPVAKAAGFQVVEAAFALAAGGLTGAGPGLGDPARIPARETDFIFAVIGEELGLLGGAAVLAAYLLLVGAALRIALRADNPFEKLLTTGLATLIGVQAFLIIGGVIRVLPLTGVTLPFVSFGGSSLVANYVILALLMRISDETARRARERGERPDRQLGAAEGSADGVPVAGIA